MKPDISNRADIETVINAFYDKVITDVKIGHYFTDVVKVNWDQHLPVMYSFWENIIFHSGIYEGNPMELHQKLNKKSTLKMEHFQRWTKLFTETVDTLFEGDKAEYMKQRAMSIATVMQIKIFS
ncbi:MAG: group III truncated hemoglobin [Bacteroidetes bacterium]|nr:group III truncated hemoglobin [Bacteroidota bacterium]